MSDEKDTPGSFARRDDLLKIEAAVQLEWAKSRIHEVDADSSWKVDEKGSTKDKYFCTFPYPYMNGVLHLGHAFTLSKAEFQARFQRLLGKRVLFPFAYHCTGMPIAACADKLKRELKEYGNPPVFPAAHELSDEKEDESRQGQVDAKRALQADQKEDETGRAEAQGKKQIAEVRKEGEAKHAEAQEKQEQAVQKEDETKQAEAQEKQEHAVQKEDETQQKKPITKKAKVANKTGKEMYQWNIMREMGVDEEEIADFQDASHWIHYFPPLAEAHLKRFGLCADFRRSFITTAANPFYDRFVRWQFKTLKARGKIEFGTRNTIYSPLDKQPCADHDRSVGEGVGVQEYTIIKLAVLDPPAKVKAMVPAGRTVFLPAATLRPETMYGQTNVFLLPEAVYGVFEVSAKDVFICSDRSALNMSYQNLSLERGKPKKLGEVAGSDLIGCAVLAPLSFYKQVYVLPLFTIKMNKGTGVVTSVPSDAPDDYAALMDLAHKPKLREKYHIAEHMVKPFAPVPIVSIPKYGTCSAPALCEEKGVKSQHDSKLLEDIKTLVYKEAFYQGVMEIGEHKGVAVKDAKPLIRQMLIDRGEACAYAEPESTVISRSGAECVVALTDQWYLKYGEEEWKAAVKAHMQDSLETYNPATTKKFGEALEWLREWACSRSYGLGTQLPWDEPFVIESLSDSTIYMAYYTVAHLLQGGSLDGSSELGPLGVRPEQMSDAVWDFIFLRGPLPKDCDLDERTLNRLRHEFEYWYPMDLRVSGKDLIANHLTMSLYNHAAIWSKRPELWPRSFFANGHAMINAKKMAKSTGNFLTLMECIETYSADATRVALADAGDDLDDANFARVAADRAVLRLTKEKNWIEEVLKAEIPLRRDAKEAYTFWDRVFENEIHQAIAACKQAYSTLQYRNALKAALFDLSNARDNYRASSSPEPMHGALVTRWIEVFLVMLSPIAPHFCQHLWHLLGNKDDIGLAAFPRVEPENQVLTRQAAYLRDTANAVRVALIKQKTQRGRNTRETKAKVESKAADGESATELAMMDSISSLPKSSSDEDKARDAKSELNAVHFFVADGYPEWQLRTLETVARFYQNVCTDDIKNATDDLKRQSAIDLKRVAAELATVPVLKAKKPLLNQAMAFARFIVDEVKVRGNSALEIHLPFDEEKLLREHADFVTRNTSIDKIEIHRQAHSDGAVGLAAAENCRQQAKPGRPGIYVYHRLAVSDVSAT